MLLYKNEVHRFALLPGEEQNKHSPYIRLNHEAHMGSLVLQKKYMP